MEIYFQNDLLKSKFGDALVTAIHFNASAEIVKLLLDKGASLTSRHADWVCFKKIHSYEILLDSSDCFRKSPI
jgi:hypothetical protein